MEEIKIHFSDQEKKDFLLKKGFKLVEHKYTYRYQWGNHDSQDEEREAKIICAIRGDLQPKPDFEYREVFKVLMAMEIKHKLLGK